MGSQSLAVSGVGLHLPSPRSTMLKIVLILFLSAVMAETAPAEQDRMFMGPIYHNYKIKGQRLRINRAVKTRTAKICGQKCTFYNTKNSGAAETCAAWLWRQNNKKLKYRLRRRCIFLKNADGSHFQSKKRPKGGRVDIRHNRTRLGIRHDGSKIEHWKGNYFLQQNIFETQQNMSLVNVVHQ